jgi:hypothetical protein
VKAKELDVDPKYLKILGYEVNYETITTTRILNFNITRQNFSIVSYVLQNELAAAILYLQNLASIMPSENLLIYDLGLSKADTHTLTSNCNSSSIKCTILKQDLSEFPSYIMDDKLHLFRPILIKDALSRFRTILFMANHVRLRTTNKALNEIRKRTEERNHVTSLEVKTMPITSNTHPRMFDYLANSDADLFLFVRQVTLDAVFFHHSKFLEDKILLPWLKCVLTPQCIQVGSE